MSKANELKVVNVRLVKEPSLYSAEPISSPDDVLKIVAKEMATYDREVFAILNLKTNGQPKHLQRRDTERIDGQPTRGLQIEYPLQCRRIHRHTQPSFRQSGSK